MIKPHVSDENAARQSSVGWNNARDGQEVVDQPTTVFRPLVTRDEQDRVAGESRTRGDVEHALLSEPKLLGFAELFIEDAPPLSSDVSGSERGDVPLVAPGALQC